MESLSSIVSSFSKVSLVIIVLTLLCSCATPRPWTKGEKVAAGYFLVAHFADYYTTERALDSPNTYENNQFLGEQPSDSKLMIYFSLSAFAILAVGHFWPDSRQPLLFGFGTLRTYSATRNTEFY